MFDVRQYSIIHQINKGWSNDQKYLMERDGIKYLLRVSSINERDTKTLEFEKMKEVFQTDIPMAKPIELGFDEEHVYTVLSWIEGSDFVDVIDRFSEIQQYNFGRESGQILKKIQSVSVPDDLENWNEKFSRKIDSKIKNYHACELKYDRDEMFLEYITNNRHLIEDRPNTYQHGDYHINNFMINEQNQLVVIDFNRHDYGDPWEEFNRIVWSAQTSPTFASGMIDGYFNDKVPDLFWRLMKLYIYSNVLSSLPWAIPFGEEEVKTMKTLAKDIISWYKDTDTVVPTWYQSKTDKNSLS